TNDMIVDFQSDWRTTKSVLDGGHRLAKQLRSLEFAKRFEMINEVWIEMLSHAAAHCPWKEHAQQLRRGGELLTHEVKELKRVVANKEIELVVVD
ncbi:unnamed protein product, partial [Dovyalis caffra]